MKRKDVPTTETWDLSLIFPDETSYESALEALRQRSRAFAEHWRPRLQEATVEELREALESFEAICRARDRVTAYSSLALAVDYGDPEANRRYGRLLPQLEALAQELSFFDSGLAAQSEERLVALGKGGYEAFTASILRDKPHRLSPETEEVLAGLSGLQELPYRVYEAAKLADLRFPDFTAAGKTWPLTYSLYESTYCQEEDDELRRTAFQVFSDSLAAQRHTLATAYGATVSAEQRLAGLRGYDSVFDLLLASQDVTSELYSRQIDVLLAELAPVMRRYAQKLGRIYGLDRVTYADLKLKPNRGGGQTLSASQAWDTAEQALAVLGPDYTAWVQRARQERWVDFAQNEGKSTGGFCAKVADGPAYILLNWNGNLSEVFTLVHELGHAVQAMLAEENINYLDADPSLYFVEAPSTINELLLTNWLLANDPSPEGQSRVAAETIANTYYHNTVTHLLEAAFQREVYRAVEAGESLSADDLDGLFRGVLEAFWGDSVELTPGAERTWMRQPHYYMGLYPYTYSAGLVVSTAVARRIREGEPSAVADWLAVLRLGGSQTPLQLAARAGVDLGDQGPLRNMVAEIDRLVRLI